MRLTNFIISGYLLFCSINVHAQPIEFEKFHLEAVNVSLSKETIMGKAALKAIKDSTITAVDEPTYIRIKDVDFKNGTIEVKVLSRLLKNAPSIRVRVR